MIVGLEGNTLQILRDKLRNSVSIHRATMAPDSRCCWGETKKKEEGSAKEEIFPEKDLEEAR